MEIKQILNQLRRPFKPIEVEWKIQSVSKNTGGVLVVSYVDARDVMERLNKVCPGQWSDRLFPIYPPHAIEANNILGFQCEITIRADDAVVKRQDVGIGDLDEDNKTNINAGVKTLASDAFKRAGVKFGIASSLYEIPGPIWIKKMDLTEGKYLSDSTKEKLSERYHTWVNKEVTIERFGTVYE